MCQYLSYMTSIMGLSVSPLTVASSVELNLSRHPSHHELDVLITVTIMQTTNYYRQPMAMKPVNVADQLRSSVRHFLSTELGLPCSAAAQSYMQMVPSTARFQLALDLLLPLLDSSAEVKAPFNRCTSPTLTSSNSSPSVFSRRTSYTRSMHRIRSR
jgi:hypothetical protein